MSKYLYLLSFRHDPLIKIGVTDQVNLHRIRQHAASYPLDLENSYLISSANKSFINRLEKLLLTEYKDLPVGADLLEKYRGKDGHSEIRCGTALVPILRDLGFRQENNPALGIRIQKGITLPKHLINKPISVKPVILDECGNYHELMGILTYFKDKSYVFRVNYIPETEAVHIQCEVKFLNYLHNTKLLTVQIPASGYHFIQRFTSTKEYGSLSGYLSEEFFMANPAKYPNADHQLRGLRLALIEAIQTSPSYDPTYMGEPLPVYKPQPGDAPLIMYGLLRGDLSHLHQPRELFYGNGINSNKKKRKSKKATG